MSKELEELVNLWLNSDKNQVTRKEIQDLWQQGNVAELKNRLSHRIEFGTAGLRGKMEAGFARMNDLIIIQASQGLCEYVLQHVYDATKRGIVVGHDHRYNSERWAQLTAAAFISRGVRVYLHRGLVHTPLVPFSVKRMNAACGVMITASHNPKQDNGYKVYWENAVQIISPHDSGIAQSILANLEPKTWDTEAALTSPLCIDRTEEMKADYLEALAAMTTTRDINSSTTLKFVNTSMHGVSHLFVTAAFNAAGLPLFTPVKEQQNPDPDFPTVKFPNPEEKGALDLAISMGNKLNADYVLAQDPDADRFSAVERLPDGTWKTFTGDQLGTLFAARALRAYRTTGKPIGKLAMVASTVSSKMLEAMAKKEGFFFAECLTGFKFIGNKALDLVREGYEVPFGYEEAIGYMFGNEIRDKDGVAATIAFSELVAQLKTEGKGAWGYLQELYQLYGHFQTSNSYFVCHNPATIDQIFARIRNYDGKAAANAPSYPRTLAGLRVTHVRDLTIGYDTATVDHKPALPLSSGHMVQFRAESDDGRLKIALTTRTSGTEPKIKYYLEGNGPDPKAVDALLPIVVRELGEEWTEATKNGLGMP